ncbi:MAG TPA: PP2C family protein-serine/threonine phosphatase [Trebonia sp.]|jgi:sigma-B regulation protein RsbU (phosphoserine phosphatase)|nr:PP2C family protein-serine/threonine phosphatase [Trebonia sp.]
MGYEVGIIESVSGETPVQLGAALIDLGSSVEIFNVDALQRSALTPRVDVLLVSAKVPPRELNDILIRFSGDGVVPVVLVFTENRFDHLEQHIRYGRDYLMPPFLPSLLGVRMRSCYERARFGRTVTETEDSARLVAADRDMEIAREIQVGFLPVELPQPPGWELTASFQPARKVSGDFYDAFTVANGRRVAFVVADVCDKGVGAALFMALIRSLLRHTAEFSGLQSLAAEQIMASSGSGRPAVPVVGVTPMMNAVRSTNAYLTRNHAAQGYFATLFFGVLDPMTGRVAYINCGHNPPMLLSSDGLSQLQLEHTGPAVGVVPDCVFALGYTRLAPGDTLLVYTDGVTEARSPTGEFFGEERLLQAACLPGVTGKTISENVERGLYAHIGEAAQFDDITMMAIHRMPASAAAGEG